MKKLVASLLAGMMVVSLAACGNNGGGTDSKDTQAAGGDTKAESEAESKGEDNSSDGEEVTMDFAWWGNQVRTENTTAALDYYHEQHPNVTVNGMAYQWSDYWTVLATQGAGGELADLIQQDYAYISQFVESDDLLDLTPYVESGALDISKISDNILTTGKVGDGLYALCAGVNAPAMVYNKTLTDSLGIEIPDNMTMEQFREIGKEIYEKSGVRTQYGYGNSENPLTYWIRSKGYTSFWGDNSLSYEDASVMEDYYQYLIDGAAEGWLMDTTTYADVDTTSVEQNPLVYSTSPNTQAWNNNCFSNMYVAFVKAAGEDVELAMTTWPSDDPKASNYEKPSQFFAVTTDAEDPDAAVAVLNYLINDLEGNKLLAAERGVPANSDVAAAMQDIIGEDIVTYLNDVVADNCSPIFGPLPNSSSEVINTVIQELGEKTLFAGGGITAAEAAEELFTRANEIMGGN